MAKKIETFHKDDYRKIYIFNIFKVLKYYFKHIFYILIINAIYLFIYKIFLQEWLRGHLSKIAFNHTFFEISLYLVIFCLMSIPKFIIYGNTIIIMKKKGSNDIADLLGKVYTRYVAVLGTLLIYFVISILMYLLLVLPGIYFTFSYSLGVFLSAVGDINNPEKSEKYGNTRYLNGTSALDRSRTLIRKNFFKFMFLTFIIVGITFSLDYSFIYLLKTFRRNTPTMLSFIRICVWDILYIYFAYMFVKFQQLEKEILDEQEEKAKADAEKLKKAAVNKFKPAK